MNQTDKDWLSTLYKMPESSSTGYPLSKEGGRILGFDDLSKLTVKQVLVLRGISLTIVDCEGVGQTELPYRYWCTDCKRKYERVFELFERFLIINEKHLGTRSGVSDKITEYLKQLRKEQGGDIESNPS